MQVADQRERLDQVLDRARPLEGKRRQERRAEQAHGRIARDQLGGPVERPGPRDTLGLGHSGDEARPIHFLLNGDQNIGALLLGVDQRAPGNPERSQIALHLARRRCRLFVGALVGGAAESRHQLLEHRQARVGQRRFERDRRSGERRVPTQRVEFAQMLDCELLGLDREPLEYPRGQRRLARAVDPEAADMLDTVDQFADAARLGSLWRAAQPSKPAQLARRRALLEQRVEAGERVGGEIGGQHLVREPFSADARAADHGFEHQWRRQRDAVAAQLLDEDARELAGSDDRLCRARQERDGGE